MTIDEYLNQARTLKYKADKAKARFEEYESRAINPRSPLDLGDGIPAGRTNANGTETRLIEYIDAGKAYTAAANNYSEFRHQLQNTINYLLHWEALIIERIYIYNIYYEYGDDLAGVDEILNTDNKRVILSKLGEAKRHLADLLRQRGVDIEK